MDPNYSATFRGYFYELIWPSDIGSRTIDNKLTEITHFVCLYEEDNDTVDGVAMCFSLVSFLQLIDPFKTLIFLRHSSLLSLYLSVDETMQILEFIRITVIQPQATVIRYLSALLYDSAFASNF